MIAAIPQVVETAVGPDPIANAIALAGAMFALVGVLIGGVFASLNLSRERLNQRVNIAAVRQKYFDDIRRWANDACDMATEAIHLCDLDPGRTENPNFFERRHTLLVAVSSMIDKGRWFFPNIAVEDFGLHKEPGYQGYRHEVLDGLTAIHRALKRMSYVDKADNRSVRDELTRAKRNFVGQVQKILDPGTQAEEFSKIGELASGRARPSSR